MTRNPSFFKFLAKTTLKVVKIKLPVYVVLKPLFAGYFCVVFNPVKYENQIQYSKKPVFNQILMKTRSSILLKPEIDAP